MCNGNSKTLNPLLTPVYNISLLLQCCLNYTAMVYKYIDTIIIR